MGKHSKSIRHYFVDEAGDGVLFNKNGGLTLGKEGCSKFFILGLADIKNPSTLEEELTKLRQHLLEDPYFKGVPSMQLKAGKTAICFHAKDDIPEVRREVFALLLRNDIHFYAVVRNKYHVLNYVRQRNEADTSYRYHQNELYDFLIRSLFAQRLHKDDEYEICFAKRGNADRTKALTTSLETTRRRFCDKQKISSLAAIHIISVLSQCRAGLQAVDYFLWALQRLYERDEDRFIELLWPKIKLVRDLDDVRVARYGVYYTQKKPLNTAALKNLPGI